MTAVVYAHKAGRGNGVGLHYSRFRPSWRFIVPPNQRLGLMPPAQNRHFPPRIREVGLSARTGAPVARLRPLADSNWVEVLWWRRGAWGPAGTFGAVFDLDDALAFIADEPT